MSEIQHPPINTEYFRDTTLESDFAERAYEILSQYAISLTTIEDDYEITYPVTDRVDLISNDERVEVALRLIRHPAFAVAQNAYPDIRESSSLQTESNSDEYMVIGLQHGTLCEEEMNETEGIYDEDFDWHPYVLAVISRNGEVSVLDANTGKSLSATDIMHASFLMELMAKELRGILFEAATVGDDQIPIHHDSLMTRWEEFPVGEELDLNFTCSQCGRVNTPCGHLNQQMN